MPSDNLLARTTDLALEFLRGLPERRVGLAASIEDFRAALGGDLPERGEDPVEVIERLARRADPGIVAMALSCGRRNRRKLASPWPTLCPPCSLSSGVPPMRPGCGGG